MTISVSGKRSPSHQITRLELNLLKCILWRTLLVNNPLLDFTQTRAVDLPGQCDKLSFCEEHSLLATSTCGTVSLAIRPPRREWLVLDQCATGAAHGMTRNNEKGCTLDTDRTWQGRIWQDRRRVLPVCWVVSVCRSRASCCSPCLHLPLGLLCFVWGSVEINNASCTHTLGGGRTQ